MARSWVVFAKLTRNFPRLEESRNFFARGGVMDSAGQQHAGHCRAAIARAAIVLVARGCSADVEFALDLILADWRATRREQSHHPLPWVECRGAPSNPICAASAGSLFGARPE